ncbi:MAG: hypothetical protein VCB82_01720 [Alphaproteobacteria bacterium]
MTNTQETANETGERQKFRWRQHKNKLRIVLWLTMSAVLAYWAYSLAYDRFSQLNHELQSKLDQAQTKNDSLRADAAKAEARANILQQKYAADAPYGATRQIMALVKERLESGVSPDRVAFLVAMAENDTECEYNTDTRRFLVQTSLTTGANSAISFSNDTITVTGWGLPSRDVNDNLQSWFDAAQKIKILFTLIGGKEYRADGKLPLHHTMVTGNIEHRFTIKTGEAKGFVVVTEQRCRFP